MGIVVSLTGYWPPPRYDRIQWTTVLIYEAVLRDGPWTLIDTQVLSNPDPDPSAPGVRDFTTTAATLDTGWYQVVFEDVNGSKSGPSDPERNSILAGELPPSPEDVRNQSPLLRAKFPLPPTDPYQPGDLRTIVYQAVALVESVTFRILDPSTPTAVPDGFLAEVVPAGLVPVAFEAVARMAERIAVTTEAEFAEQLATGKILRGFSAGPYSENYFAPGEFARRGAQQGRPPMDADEALDAVLWALATEDARDYFVGRATGIMPPVGAAVAFDYRKQSRGYSAGGLGGTLPGRGPDGF